MMCVYDIYMMAYMCVCVCVCACSCEIFEGPQLKDSTLPLLPATISMKGNTLMPRPGQGRKAAGSEGRQAAESATLGAVRSGTRGSLIARPMARCFSPGVETPGAARRRPEEAQGPSSGAGKFGV